MTADNASLMINEGLTGLRVRRGALRRFAMMFELMLAGFIMAVGLAIAGTGTYFY